MGKVLFILIIMALSWRVGLLHATAQSLVFTQAQGIGTATATNSIAPRKRARDQAGNVYTSGTFLGTLSLGPVTLTSLGSYDIFLTKQDAAGNYLWVRQLGGTGYESTPYLVADAVGNLYVAAATESTNLQAGTLILNMNQAKFAIARLDIAGNFSWAVTAGGPNDLLVRDVALAPNGNLCLTGGFGGTITFGTAKISSVGNGDIVVASLTSMGTWAWATRLGGVDDDSGWGIVVDAAGNHYVTGYFAGYTGASFGTTTLYSGNYGADAFVVKLTATGAVSWAVKAGGDAADAGYGIALDDMGNPYITGTFSQTAKFGSLTLTSAGNYDVFVARLTTAGGFQWATRLGGIGYEYGDFLAIQNNEVYLAGHFFDTTTFGANTFTSAGQVDLVFCQISDTGTVLGAVAAGSTGADAVNGLQAIGNHQVEAVGYYLGSSIAFGTTVLTVPSSNNKAFVTRLTGSAVPLSTQASIVSLSDLVAWPNPATATFTLANVDTANPVEVYDVQGHLVATYTPATWLVGKPLLLRSGYYLIRNGWRVTRVIVN